MIKKTFHQGLALAVSRKIRIGIALCILIGAVVILTAANTSGSGLDVSPVSTDSQSAVPVTMAVYPVYHDDFKYDDGDWYCVSASPFDEPNCVYEGEKLKLNALGSAYSFGFWESPRIKVNENSLYRGIFLVSAYTENDQVVPSFRLRVTAVEPTEIANQAVAMLVVNSSGNGNNSPTITPRYYEVYFRAPDGCDRVRLEFDLLSFDGINDDPNVSVRLEEVWLEMLI